MTGPSSAAFLTALGSMTGLTEPGPAVLLSFPEFQCSLMH